MPIRTPHELREHLELAIRVELSTIPPYLFAMYSIEDQASDAALLIRSIAAEEMLHVALATNLLLAVGGKPRFDEASWLPTYPGFLPHHRPPLELTLEPCSLDLISEVFMRIEQPSSHGAPAEADNYETLGQFYHALEMALEELSPRFELFADPQLETQLGDASFYLPVAFDSADSGGLMFVSDVASARAAIEIIVHQGEGLSVSRWAEPSHQELTHYFKLLQICDGTTPLGPVRAVRSSPRSEDFPDGTRQVAELFNACYRYLFFLLRDLFEVPGSKGRDIGRLYGMMSGVMSSLARHLVMQPLGDGSFAAPTFEVFDLGTARPEEVLLSLGDRVSASHPALSEVVDVVVALCS